MFISTKLRFTSQIGCRMLGLEASNSRYQKSLQEFLEKSRFLRRLKSKRNLRPRNVRANPQRSSHNAPTKEKRRITHLRRRGRSLTWRSRFWGDGFHVERLHERILPGKHFMIKQRAEEWAQAMWEAWEQTQNRGMQAEKCLFWFWLTVVFRSRTSYRVE